MCSGRAGLIWQPTDAQSYYVSLAQLVQPVGRARRLRRHGADQPQRGQPEPRSGGEPQLRGRRAVGLRPRPAAALGDLPHREDQPAHRRLAIGTTCSSWRQAPRRRHRVRARRARSRPNWDVYSGIAFMDGKIVTADQRATRARRRSACRRRGQRLDGLPAGRRLGGRRRRARQLGLLADRRATTARCPRYTRVRRDGRPTCRSKYEMRAERLQPRPTRSTTSAATRTRPNRVIPGAAARARAHVALQLRLSQCCSRRMPRRSSTSAPSRSRSSARASTPRAGSTATSPRATSRRRRSTTSSCPRNRRRRASWARRSLAALARSPLFFSAALPKQVFPPLFNRYGQGMNFGNHVDSAIRTPRRAAGCASAPTSRRRCSSTAPEDYDGGELLVEDTYGVQQREARRRATWCSIRRPACTASTPVTRGARVRRSSGSRAWCATTRSARCSSTWTWRSCGSRASARAIPALVSLTGVYHNLLRMWAEPDRRRSRRAVQAPSARCIFSRKSLRPIPRCAVPVRVVERQRVRFGEFVEGVEQQLQGEENEEDRGRLEEQRQVDATALAHPGRRRAAAASAVPPRPRRRAALSAPVWRAMRRGDERHLHALARDHQHHEQEHADPGARRPVCAPRSRCGRRSRRSALDAP